MNSLDLIAAHMVGDYITQTPYMAANKLADPRTRAWHVSTYTAGFILLVLLSSAPLWRKVLFLSLVWATHFITDSRRWASGEQWPPKPILVDQSIHLATLALLSRLIRRA